ncbi:MAG: EamA family transporter [Actinomycetota bacterium]
MADLSARVWIALAAVYIVWGSTYLAIAIGIETLPPLVMAGTRFGFAGLLLLAIVGRKMPRRPTLEELRNAAIIGTALCLGGNGLVTIAEARIASGTAALLVATVPLWLASLDRVVLGARLSRGVTAGLLVGFIGTALLVQPGGTGDMIGALQVAAAAALWASGSLFARRSAAVAPPLANIGFQMLFGGLATLVVATLGGEWSELDLSAMSASSAYAWLYLVFAGSLIGYTAYVWLLRNAPTSVVGTYAYVNPVIAVSLGMVIRDERLAGQTLLGGAIVLASVAVIVATGKRKRSVSDMPVEPA